MQQHPFRLSVLSAATRHCASTIAVWIRRGACVGAVGMSARPRARRFVAETLEARWLLSADLLASAAWETAPPTSPGEPVVAFDAAVAPAAAGEPATAVQVNLSPEALAAAVTATFSHAALDADQAAALNAGLARLQAFADSLDTAGVMGTTLPLVGRSLGSLVDLGGIVKAQLVEPVAAYLSDPSLFPTPLSPAGVPNTTGLVAALQARLSAADSSAVVTGGLTEDAQQLLFTVDFTAAQAQTLPADMNAAIADGDVHFNAAASLEVQTSARLSLTFGIGLALVPVTPEAFFARVNGLGADARINASGLAVGATIGPVDAAVNGGTVTMDATVAVTFENATLSYAQLQAPPQASLSGSGTLDAKLPIQASVAGHTVVSPQLDLHFANVFDAGTRTLGKANFAEVLDIAAMLESFGSPDGLSTLLTRLQASLDGSVFGKNLPLVGEQLQSIVQLLAQVRGEDANGNHTLDSGEDLNGNGTLDAGIIDRFKAAGGLNVEALQQALFEVLGPAGGLNMLDKDLDDAGDDGMPDAAPDLHDVLVAVDGQKVQFDLRLKGSLDRTLPFDIGLPGLGLAVNGDVAAHLGYTVALGFGATMQGSQPEFYIETGQQPELTLDAGVTLPNLSLTGSLGYLHLDVADRDPANSPSHFAATFSVDLKDPDNDGRLLLSELSTLTDLGTLVAPTLSGDAKVDLKLTVNVGDANFPSFSTNFLLDWKFDASSDLRGNRPSVSFNQTALDLGNYFKKFAGPIVDEINTVLAPLVPIRDFLNTRIPVLSDFSPLVDLLDENADREVTLKDLAIKANREFQLGLDTTLLDDIDALIGLAERITSFIGSSGQIPLDFGSRSLAVDIRDVEGGHLHEGGLTVDQPAPAGDQIPAGSAAHGLLDDLHALGVTIAPFNGANGAFDPGTIFDLLLGKPGVNLLLWEPAPVVLGSETRDIFKVAIPIIPPFLDATIGGTLFLKAQLGFGYDTAGLVAFKASDFSDTTALAEGFFVSDHKNPSTGADDPELVLGGSIAASASINAVLLRAGVTGDVSADISFDLHDRNGDGKVSLREIEQRLGVGSYYGVGPLALFDLSGALTAGLSAFVWTGVSIPFDGTLTAFEARKEFFRGTLLDYSFTYPDDIPTPSAPQLGVLSGNTLTLSMTDGNDDYSVSLLPPGDSPPPTGQVLLVKARGHAEVFRGVTHVVAHAGAGNDHVAIAADVQASAELYGDAGDDTLKAGHGAAVIDGGQGNDVMVGGAGADDIRDSGRVSAWMTNAPNGAPATDADDVIFGGGGNDTLDGGEGRDWLEGGVGDDQLLDSGVLALSTTTIDPRSGATATDADDRLYGDDSAAVDPAAGVGGTGNDTLQAGAGNDALTGGTGDDLLRGGSGDDRYVFAAGWGQESIEELATDAGWDTADFSDLETGLQVQLGDGAVRIAEPVAGSELQAANLEALNASRGHDRFDILSTAAAPLDIHGNEGNDAVFGANADSRWTMRGEGAFTLDDLTFRAVESIAAGAGQDALDYSSFDTAVQVDLAQGTATGLIGIAGIEHVVGGAGSDTLIGDDGANVLLGGAGTNLLQGGAGDDIYRFTGDWGRNTVEDSSGEDTVDFAAVPGDLQLTLDGVTLTVSESGANHMLGATHIEHVLTGSGSDRVAIGRATPSVVDVKAGTGEDTVAGPDLPTTWWIVGDNRVVQGSLLLDSVENLAGGAQSDEFKLVDGRGVAGSITGGGGTDTLSYEAYGDGVAVDLQRGSATRVARGVSGIENVVGGDAADVLAGDGADNVLAGRGGNDTLEGRGGNDSLYGGGGDDRYVFAGPQLGADVLVESDLHNDDHDSLDFSAFTEGVQLDLASPARQTVTPTHLALTLADPQGFEDALGSATRGNALSGNRRDNRLQGGAADDRLAGGAGDDRYVFLDGWGTDTVLEATGEGMDTYDLSQVSTNVVASIAVGDMSVASGSHRIVSPDAPMDTLITGSGQDRFVFGGTSGILGSIDAGAGRDLLDYGAWGRGVAVDLDEGYAAGAGRAVTNIEDVIGSTQADTLTGDGRANTLAGNGGDDWLQGLAGDDVLEGGAGVDRQFGGTGNDRYVFAGASLGSDSLFESMGVPGGPANDDLDVLDFSRFDHSVQVDLGLTTAQVVGADASDLALRLSGVDAFEAVVGSSNADILIGNARANVLEGGRGNDQLTGRSGHDRYVFAGTQLGVDAVFEQGGLRDPANDLHDQLDFSAFGGGPVALDLGRTAQQFVSPGQLSLYLPGDGLSVEDVVGSAFSDTLRGNARFNTYGFRDGWGRDTITEAAGGGDDTFDFSAVTKSLVVRVSDMNVSSGSNLATSVGEKIENAIGGQADDRFDFGKDGSTTGYLDGGGGEDTLNYAAHGEAVTVILSKGLATGAGDGHAGMARRIENVVGSRGDDTLQGDDGANRLDGNGGNDKLLGLGGSDVLTLRPTSDAAVADLVIDGGAGVDTLRYLGSALDLRTVGGAAVRGLERIDIRDSRDAALWLDAAAIRQTVSGDQAASLTVIADEGDRVGDDDAAVKEDTEHWTFKHNDIEGGMRFAVYDSSLDPQVQVRLTQCRLGDLNCDGRVDMADFNLLMGVVKAGTSSDPLYDLNRNGVVNVADSRFLVTLFDPAPLAPAAALPAMASPAMPVTGAMVSAADGALQAPNERLRA